ncbi:MAG: KH domain-containing protein [Nanoarchaeota archaeon]
MEEYSYELKIPKERIAVLIGTKGKVKKEIEDITNTKIVIDSKDGDVNVIGEDSVVIFNVKEVIKAIARGFNPNTALLLLKQDYCLELIEISDYVKSKNQFLRQKGRIIGREGKARKNIEHLTDTDICVYGKTIGIIGRYENANISRRALDSLLSGSPHATVYKWLEKKRRELTSMDFELKKDGTKDFIK